MSCLSCCPSRLWPLEPDLPVRCVFQGGGHEYNIRGIHGSVLSCHDGSLVLTKSLSPYKNVVLCCALCLCVNVWLHVMFPNGVI